MPLPRLKAFDLVEDHLWSSTNPQVFGQIRPTNHPRCPQEIRQVPRDVFAVFSGARVKDSVFADDLCFWIRQEWEAVPLGLTELL